MIRGVLVALLSHWRRQPLQLLTLVLGLALATALWSAVQAINSEARANYAEAAAQLQAGALPEITGAGPIDLATYAQLRRAGWRVTPVIEGRRRIDGEFYSLLGVDLLAHPLSGAALGEGGATPLEALTPPGRIFARPDLATRLRGADLPPVIASGQVPAGVILGDIGTIEGLLDRRGEIDRLLVLPGPRPDSALSAIAPGLTETAAQDTPDTARLTKSFHLNLTAFGFLSFAVGLFIVHGAAGLALEQRRGTVRVLRAIGTPLWAIAAGLLLETLMLALIAGALGVMLGYGVAAVLLPEVAATLRGLYGAEVAGALSLRPGWVLAGLAMAVCGAIVAGAEGIWSLSRAPLLTATHRNGAGGVRVAVLQVLGAALLVLVGILAIAVFDGLVAGFTFLGGVLLGCALLLPPVLRGILTLAGRFARRPTPVWFWADARAQLPGLSLALMALMLALATNIGVGTMVSSFRLTFTGWLDQRLPSEMYVFAATDAEGAAMADWLAPQVDKLLPIRFADAELNGVPGRVYGVLDHATYRDNWPLLEAAPDVWDRLAAGRGVLVNEQLARRERLSLGDPVQLNTAPALPIAGVYSDYGNPSAQAIVSMDVLLKTFEAVPNQQFAIRVDPARVPALSAALREEFNLPPDGVVDQAAVKKLSMDIFDKTFVVTGALNILTLGVAGFAIFTSLLTLWTMRLPQVAPVWALGATRRSLARMDFARSIALAALTAVIALPVGLLLAWALLAVINVEAFGWRLPMHLFPADWLWLGLMAVGAAALAALWPAFRLTRTPPAELLKVFADER